jgi:hypothetical protein
MLDAIARLADQPALPERSPMGHLTAGVCASAAAHAGGRGYSVELGGGQQIRRPARPPARPCPGRPARRARPRHPCVRRGGCAPTVARPATPTPATPPAPPARRSPAARPAPGSAAETGAGSSLGSPGMARMVAPGTDIWLSKGDIAGYHPVGRSTKTEAGQVPWPERRQGLQGLASQREADRPAERYQRGEISQWPVQEKWTLWRC